MAYPSDPVDIRTPGHPPIEEIHPKVVEWMRKQEAERAARIVELELEYRLRREAERRIIELENRVVDLLAQIRRL